MRVLLIGFGRHLTSFGVRHLSSLLHEHGHESTICFLPIPANQALYPREVEALVGFVTEWAPDLVGFSLMFCDLHRASRLTRVLKERLDVPIVWGGLQASTCPDQTPPDVDFVCVGEGERPLLALCANLERGGAEERIPGIRARTASGWAAAPPAPRVADLDELPFPDYRRDTHFVLHDGRIEVLSDRRLGEHLMHAVRIHPVLSARGCPHTCSYCANSALASLGDGPYLRRRSPERVLAELTQVLERFPYLNAFVMADDLFISAPPDWLEEWCQGYEERIRLPFMCEIHPEWIRPGLLGRLRAAGLAGVAMGIQSANEAICRNVYSRDVPLTTVLDGLQTLDREAPDVYRLYDIIVDNPYETERERANTVLWLNRLPRNFTLSLFPLLFYPGTELAARAEREGLLPDQGPLLIAGEHCLYRPDYLNRVLRSLPSTPARLIRLWTERRERAWVRVSFYLYYYGYFVSLRRLLHDVKKLATLRLLPLLDRDRRRRGRRTLRYVQL